MSQTQVGLGVFRHLQGRLPGAEGIEVGCQYLCFYEGGLQ